MSLKIKYSDNFNIDSGKKRNKCQHFENESPIVWCMIDS